MNILLVSPLPPPAGGIATWTKRYIESDFAKEHNVYVANTAVCGKRVKQINKRNLLSEITRTRTILKDIENLCNAHNIDVCHLNSPCGTFGLVRDYICAKVIKKKGIKLVTHFRCDVTYQLKKNFSRKYFEKLVEISDEILTLNKVSNDYINKNYGKATKQIANFIPDVYLNRTSIRKEIRTEINTIVYVGHVVKSKGCDCIVEIANQFPNIQFILVGYLSQEIQMLEKPNNVIFTGELPLEDVMSYMEKADVFLFPTHSEGFANALAEAMATGLPVITTPVGANVDMIENKGGFIVPVKDVDKMVYAIDKIKNKEIRQKMSIWNQEKVKSTYSIDKVLNQLLEIYERGTL